MEDDDRPLTLPELATVLRDRIGEQLAAAPEDSACSEVDSLLLVEMVLVIEELGVRIRDQWLDDIQDFTDLHHYYVLAWKERETGSPRAPNHPLVGRSALLRPLLPQDVTPLYAGFQEPSVAQTWRFRSRTPSPEAFQAALWDGVLLQYIICSPTSSEPLGLITAFNEDRGAGHCELGLAMCSVYKIRRIATEASILFISHLFDRFALRKIYMETLDLTADRLGLARHSLVHLEGCKREHELIAGNLHDTLLFAIYRADWQTALKRGLPGFGSLEPSHGSEPIDR